MNIIKKVTEEDIGKIAVSTDASSSFVVKVLSASNEEGDCIVKHLEESRGNGIANNFTMIGGGWPMMWKDVYSNPRRKNKIKKQPPKRKKTDATITYTNGKSYILKNVESVFCYVDGYDNNIYFSIKKSIGEIKSITSISIPVNTISFIYIKSPSGVMSALFYPGYVDIKDRGLTFTQKISELNFNKEF